MLKANGRHPLPGGQLQVSRDLSGGVRIAFAGIGFVLSPADAIAFASAILKYAGVDVSFETVVGPIRTDAVP